MKVATITSIAFRTGAHSRHKEMAMALASRNHQICWVGPSESDLESLKGVDYLPLGFGWTEKIPFLGSKLRLLLAVYSYRNLFNDCDLVFATSVYEAFSIAWVTRKSSAVSIFFERASIISQTEFMSTVEKRYVVRKGWKIKNYFFRHLYKQMFKYLGRVVVQTPNQLENLYSALGDISYPVASILPNSIDASWMNGEVASNEFVSRSPEEKLVGLVCNFGHAYWHIKGMELFIESASAIHSVSDRVRFIIVGEGPARDRLEDRLSRRVDMHKVTFLGRVKCAVNVIDQLDLVLVPSAYDVCPNVVLECLAKRVPVVATDIPAHLFLLGKNSCISAEPRIIAKEAASILLCEQYMFEVLQRQSLAVKKFNFNWLEKLVGEMEDSVISA